MQSALTRQLLLVVALILAPPLAQASPVSGQKSMGSAQLARIDGGSFRLPQPPGPTVAGPAMFAQTHQFTTTLPLVMAGPAITPLQFASQLDPQTNAPVNPSTTFTYGIETLYAVTKVSGGKGLTFRFDWSFPRIGKDTSTTFEDTIPENDVRLSPGIGVIGSDPRLPRGTYRVKFYLNGVLAQEASAEIK